MKANVSQSVVPHPSPRVSNLVLHVPRMPVRLMLAALVVARETLSSDRVFRHDYKPDSCSIPTLTPD